MKSLTAKIVNSVVWSALETGGRQFALLLVFIILSRYLGPDALGLAALSMSLPLFLLIPLQQGIPDALVRGDDIRQSHFDSAFWFIVGLGFLFTIGIYLSASLFATALGMPELKLLVEWSSLIVFVRSVAIVPSAYMRKSLEYRLFAIRSLVGTTVGGSVGLYMAIAGYGVWSMIGLQLAKSLAESILMLFAGKWTPRLRFSYSKCKDLFGFSVPMLGVTLIYLLTEEIPKILLGYLSGPAAVGIYALARRILEFLTEFFVRPLTLVAFPAVSKLKADNAKLEQFYRQSILVGNLIGIPASLGFAAIAPVAVPFIFGQHWTVAVLAVQLIMLLGLQRTTDNLTSWVIVGLGHASLVFRISAAYLIFEMIAVGIAAHYGAEATIAALTGINLLFVPVYLVQLRRVGNIDTAGAVSVLPRLLIIGVAMAACVFICQTLLAGHLSPAANLAGSVITGVIVYTAGILLLLRQELTTALHLFRKVRRGEPQQNSPVETLSELESPATIK